MAPSGQGAVWGPSCALQQGPALGTRVLTSLVVLRLVLRLSPEIGSQAVPAEISADKILVHPNGKPCLIFPLCHSETLGNWLLDPSNYAVTLCQEVRLPCPGDPASGPGSFPATSPFSSSMLDGRSEVE